MAHLKAQDLEAFCAICPAVQEVGDFLQTLGFELSFHMDADASPAYEQLPPLPAQFHFRDKLGNEVIYLEGRDADLDGVHVPEHASRFWAYPGADVAAYRHLASVLAIKWSLAWQPSTQAHQHVA